MTFQEVMAELEARGTEPMRELYARHGVGGPTFGASLAHLRALQRSIRHDQEMATALWATGNHDARVLATLVADPEIITSSELEDWARDLDNPILTDALSSLVSKTPFVDEKIEKWCAMKSEWRAAAGWNLVANAAMSGGEIADEYFEVCLEEIEADIPESANRVRHAMNQALICIGVRNGKLRRKALAAAKRIGRVEVDHGESGETTPDAVGYLDRDRAEQAKGQGG